MVPALRKVAVLCILLLLAASITPGCWNRRDPELLAIVLATGFDFDEERGLYQVIAQVANPVTMEEGGGQAGEQRAFWTVSAFGHTPFEAMRRLSEGSSRELFWAHNRVLLFSEKLARRGIRHVLDLFERERQLRMIARPVVVEGDLRKLMEAEFPLEESGARGLDRQIVTIQFEGSVFPVLFISELYIIFDAAGKEMFIGRIEVREEAVEQQETQEGEQQQEGQDDGEQDNQGGGSSNSPPGTPPPAKIGGGALFRGEQMVGWATENETRGWLYTTGRGLRYTLVIESPADNGSYLSIEIVETRVDMRPAGDKDDPRIELKVIADGRIQDISSPAGLQRESEFTRSLERRAAEAVRNDIEAALARAQELKSDIFGFGNLFYRKRPRLWREIENRWDEIFPELVVDIEVELKLRRTGLFTDPM